MPKAARGLVTQEMDDWARLGVAGHFDAKHPWYSYHELFREGGARVVGAVPGDVVMLHSLTVTLHLMLAAFYRRAGARRSIRLVGGAFPSDADVVATDVRQRGLGAE